MRLVVTLAVGERKYGDLAINLALSIKCQTPEQKILLIYEPTAIKGIEELVEKHFDYGQLEHRHTDTAAEFAFWQKTQLYTTVMQAVPEATEIIFLDADTIMLPSKTVNEWFEKHQGRPFTSYCNDILDFKTGKRKRRDYTFWCDPAKVKEHYNLSDFNKIPQINSSFLYFEKGELAKTYFQVASNVWNDDNIQYTEYKNTKPDELCFNIASAITNILPHQTTYRPIFFQFGSEQQNISYINHYYKSFGFAGTASPHDYLVKFYNDTSEYYRYHFGIAESFKYKPPLYSETEYLSIQPLSRRTLYRRGELPNSDGGVFNPSAILRAYGLCTIYRKEAGIEKAMYVGTTAVAHIEYLNESTELKTTIPPGMRVEDFRLFDYDGQLMCGHSIAQNIYTTNIECKCAISEIKGDELNYIGIPNLPIETKKVEKNWVFFSEEKRLFCLYSLQPYKLFYTDDLIAWHPHEVGQKKLKWLDESYLSNSTNPILIDNHYLVFFHSKANGGYHHGAALIDKETKQITHCTPKAINIESGKEGFNPKITYVSGAVYFKDKDIIRVFAGEGDAHAIYFDFNAGKLIKEIKRYKC